MRRDGSRDSASCSRDRAGRWVSAKRGLQCSADGRFLFDGVAACDDGAGERCDWAVFVSGQCVDGGLTERFAGTMRMHTDVDDADVGAGFRESRNDARGDANPAEVGVRGQQDSLGAPSEFDNPPERDVGGLPGEPDDGGVGVAVADRFGGLQVLDQQKRRRAAEVWAHGGIVRAELHGPGEPTEVYGRCAGSCRNVQRSAQADVGTAAQTQGEEGDRVGPGVQEDVGNVVSYLGVLEMGL